MSCFKIFNAINTGYGFHTLFWKKPSPVELKGWEHNRLMSNFSPFFDVAQICANFCM